MQFMTMLKMRENAGAPPPDFFETMGAYIAGVAASGKLITTGGLLPSSAGAEGGGHRAGEGVRATARRQLARLGGVVGDPADRGAVTALPRR
jgi:hypothetical protein